MIWTPNTPSIRQRIMKILVDEGPQFVRDIEKRLPEYSRRQIESALGKLRRDQRVHRTGTRPGQRNQRYGAGADPNLKGVDLYDQDKRKELEHRLMLNPHLHADWKPRPDLAAAWLFDRAA